MPGRWGPLHPRIGEPGAEQAREETGDGEGRKRQFGPVQTTRHGHRQGHEHSSQAVGHAHGDRAGGALALGEQLLPVADQDRQGRPQEHPRKSESGQEHEPGPGPGHEPHQRHDEERQQPEHPALAITADKQGADEAAAADPGQEQRLRQADLGIGPTLSLEQERQAQRHAQDREDPEHPDHEHQRQGGSPGADERPPGQRSAPTPRGRIRLFGHPPQAGGEEAEDREAPGHAPGQGRQAEPGGQRTAVERADGLADRAADRKQRHRPAPVERRTRPRQRRRLGVERRDPQAAHDQEHVELRQRADEPDAAQAEHAERRSHIEEPAVPPAVAPVPEEQLAHRGRQAPGDERPLNRPLVDRQPGLQVGPEGLDHRGEEVHQPMCQHEQDEDRKTPVQCGLTPRTIERQQSMRTLPSGRTQGKNPRAWGPASSRARTSSLLSDGVPRSNHSSKSSINASSTCRTSPSPARISRSTSAGRQAARMRAVPAAFHVLMSLLGRGVGIGRVVAENEHSPRPEQLHLAPDEGQRVESYDAAHGVISRRRTVPSGRCQRRKSG